MLGRNLDGALFIVCFRKEVEEHVENASAGCALLCLKPLGEMRKRQVSVFYCLEDTAGDRSRKRVESGLRLRVDAYDYRVDKIANDVLPFNPITSG